MGANSFIDIGTGTSAKEAFNALREESLDRDGNEYSGCIGMKSKFVMIECPSDKEPRNFAFELIKNDDPRVSEKYGPCGCIALGDGAWLFFGWAAS